METNTMAVTPVERSFEENVKITLNKLALDYTENGTLEELAHLIGVHPVTIYTWCKQGSVPPHRARFMERTFGSHNVKAAELTRNPL